MRRLRLPIGICGRRRAAFAGPAVDVAVGAEVDFAVGRAVVGGGDGIVFF